MEEDLSESAHMSRLQILVEILQDKRTRNALLLTLLYSIATISIFLFLVYFLIYFIYLTQLTKIFELILIIILILFFSYFFTIGDAFLFSTILYLIIDPEIDLSDAMKSLLKLGKKWLIFYFLLIKSSIISLKYFIHKYNYKHLIPFSKPNISVGEWTSIMILIFPIMAMKGTSLEEATDELNKFHTKYSQLFYKRGIQYMLFPFAMVGIFFGSIFAGFYLGNFIFVLFRINPQSELYARILTLNIFTIPYFVAIFVWILFYGTREIFYAKLYAKELRREKKWKKLKEKWRKKVFTLSS